jgi:hypothetical protein
MGRSGEVRTRVRRLLTDRLGTVTVDRAGDAVIEHGTVRVFVSVNDAPDGNHTIITVNSVTNWDLEPDPGLFRYVATRSNDIAFGTLSVVERRDRKCNVNLHYAMLGDTVDPDDLLNAVSAVATVADEVDDEVVRRFGGRRTIEPGAANQAHRATDRAAQ